MMMTGTRNVSTPRNFHFGCISSYAPMALFCVFLPIAMSEVSSVKPNVSTNTR